MANAAAIVPDDMRSAVRRDSDPRPVIKPHLRNTSPRPRRADVTADPDRNADALFFSVINQGDEVDRSVWGDREIAVGITNRTLGLAANVDASPRLAVVEALPELGSTRRHVPCDELHTGRVFNNHRLAGGRTESLDMLGKHQLGDSWTA